MVKLSRGSRFPNQFILCSILTSISWNCYANFEYDPHVSSITRPNINDNDRKLEDVDNAKFDYDLSGYSIRFGKCQHVKMFTDELAEDEESDTVLSKRHFVLYRMCPSDECASCDENYGEYVVEVEEYLGNIAEFHKEEFEIQCEICAQNNYKCENINDDNVQRACVCSDCDHYYNMGDNGYVDATEFIECQKLEVGNDDDNNQDDDELELYIGPRCTNEGSKIIIDVFQDENCWEVYEGANVQTLLGMKLSYLFLQTSYSTDSSDCLSCLESDYAIYEENDRDQQDEDDVLEMCENIYLESAKCETKHGFVNGFMKVYGYENQIQNEYDVCTFIDSLAWGSYNEKGEINVGDTQDVVIRYITPLQASVLIILSSIIIGLGAYAIKLFLYIESLYPATELKDQGGVFT